MSKSSNNSGIGFVGLLTILFIGLKLTKFIDWNWWWVLSPVWVTAVVVVVFIIIAAIVEVKTEEKEVKRIERKRNL